MKWGGLFAVLLLSLSGCGKDDAGRGVKAANPASQAIGRTAGVPAGGARVAAVKPAEEDAALKTFCDKRWPASGPKSRAFGEGPAATPPKGAKNAGKWRWINYWATWCKPCLAEMPMLGRWRDALVKDGLPVALELWSVDEDEAALKARVGKGVPGEVWRIAGPDPLGDYLAGLGMARDSVLPIHMVVDPQGKLRCVRVGSVRPAHWGTVKKLLR